MRDGDEDDRESGLAKPVGQESPEEQELAWKRAEQQRVLQQTIDLETQVTVLRSNLEAFAHLRLFRFGRLLAKRDDLRACVEEALAARHPGDPVWQRRAQEARARARQTVEGAAAAEEAGLPRRVAITQELRQEYRRGARLMHPDLGRTDEEREQRHPYMVRLNHAYCLGDFEALRDVIVAWESAAPPSPSEDVGQALIRTIRGIARLRKTLERLELELQDLRARPEHVLMVDAKRAEAEGRDLFQELEETLQTEVDALATRLERIRRGEDE